MARLSSVDTIVDYSSLEIDGIDFMRVSRYTTRDWVGDTLILKESDWVSIKFGIYPCSEDPEEILLSGTTEYIGDIRELSETTIKEFFEKCRVQTEKYLEESYCDSLQRIRDLTWN